MLSASDRPTLFSYRSIKTLGTGKGQSVMLSKFDFSPIEDNDVVQSRAPLIYSNAGCGFVIYRILPSRRKEVGFALTEAARDAMLRLLSIISN